MLSRAWRRLRDDFLRKDKRGVAAMEFAFIAPILVLMIGCVPDLGNAIAASNRAGKLAETLAQLVSQSKVQLTTNDLDQILNASPLVDPAMLDYARAANVSIENSASVVVSSVAFQKKDANCKSNCQYDANVVFSRSLSGPARSCGRLNPGTGGDLGTLPPGVYSENSIIVVDVTTHFKPLVSGMFFGEMAFKRSAYFRPRYVDQVNSTQNCPGYAS